MPKRTVHIFAVTFLLFSTAAFSADVVGKWKNIDQDRYWEFENGGSIWNYKQGHQEAASGSYVTAGNSVSFTLSWMADGKRRTCAYAAVINGNIMSVTYVLDDGSSQNFKLKRVN